jgi:hypothetical protein
MISLRLAVPAVLVAVAVPRCVSYIFSRRQVAVPLFHLPNRNVSLIWNSRAIAHPSSIHDRLIGGHSHANPRCKQDYVRRANGIRLLLALSYRRRQSCEGAFVGVV